MEKQLNLVVFDRFPMLETPRLLLREVQLSDAPAVFSIRNHDQVRRYLDSPLYHSVADAEKRIRNSIADFTNQRGINWIICLKQQEKMIGDFGFWRLIPRHFRAEIGYVLHPEHWGQGIMSEAMRAILDWGFTELGLHSLEANVNPKNEPSKRLLKRFGFQQEAYFRENYYFQGQFLDSMIFSLIKTDYTFKK